MLCISEGFNLRAYLCGLLILDCILGHLGCTSMIGQRQTTWLHINDLTKPRTSIQLLQRRLAEEVTRFVHGEAGLQQALKTTEVIWSEELQKRKP